VFNELLGKKFLLSRKSAQFWAKSGVFKPLYLKIEASNHLLDTFAMKSKDKPLI